MSNQQPPNPLQIAVRMFANMGQHAVTAATSKPPPRKRAGASKSAPESSAGALEGCTPCAARARANEIRDAAQTLRAGAIAPRPQTGR